ncbi:MAG TPA: M3 family oligoendopeptidase [Anaerolineae bacterium]
MNKENAKLPHWDLTVLYPGLDSAEFEAGFQSVLQSITELAELFDRHGIDRTESVPLDDETVSLFETVVNRFNAVLEDVYTMRAYISGFIATDSRNETAQALFSELQQYLSRLSLLSTRLTAWLGALDVEALIQRSELARDHAFALRRARQEARHLMSPAEEALAADLTLTGSTSWYRMFSDTTSQLMVEVELDGEMQRLPLPAAQNLAYNPDRDVRRRAYEAVQETLAGAAVPMAAALNSIKGETLTLTRRRGWDSPLDQVLFESAIDRATLDAMMAATRNAFPDFQRYLQAKARALGLPVLAWYDRLVPLGEGTQSWSYEAATQFVLDQFGTYSPGLRRLAERAFGENWIDAEPREGKRGGAFCMRLRGDESRILANYEPGFSSVGTLAHELGHAYHNLNLARRTALQRSTPMTLAETASTFCQKIVENAALKTADTEDQIVILDGLLEYATRVVLGASSDFMVEQRLFEKRKQRDLSVDELSQLTVEAQRETLGDAVDPDLLYPYRWVYVPHYYVTSYYNFPYTFGLLFGLGLYASYQADPEQFQAGYDELLASTGMGEAAELAARFGIDIRATDFWEASLDVLRADIDRLEALIDGRPMTGDR